MSKVRLTSIPVLILFCLAFVLSIFACHDGGVLSPKSFSGNGIKSPNFVRVLPGGKDALHPLKTESNSAVISASQGGVVSCGHVTLLIPAGALSEDTEITIEMENPGVLIADFGPEGLQFITPAVMRWDLTGTTAEGEAEITESIYFNETTQLWEAMDMLSPPDPNTTETEIEHFSKYASDIQG